MEFGILGPLEVRHQGAPVPLPGRTLPKLLAVLLLEPGRVVPLPRLVEAIWDDQPPGAARRRIQNSVSLLRRALADPDRERLESVGLGYRLRLDDSDLDATRFEAAVRQGRHAAQRGDRAAALDRLRAGLGLWRGPALAGLSGRLIESGAQRWEEARLAATEERIDLELGLGGEPPIGELRQLLSTHPYRQRLAGQLMTALYRAGRAAEALATFDAVRDRLVDDLGIDPDQRLRELRTAILREDPALAAPPPSPPPPLPPPSPPPLPPPPPVPAQLPADTAHFTGRADELAALDARLAAGEPAAALSALSGIGGTGKTALALHWAHRVRHRFPDGQLYVNLRGHDRTGPMSPGEALAGFLRALGLPPDLIPTDLDQASALYRSLIADRRMLVVLDNARDPAQVRPMLPSTGGSFTIVTSRHRLTGLVALDDAHPVTVGSLPATESLRLLGRLVGTDRIEAEPAAAARLVELCAGLPLALRIAAANLTLRGLPLARLVTELSGTDRVDRLAVTGDPTATVAATFDLSYRSISAEEQDLFLRLAYLPQPDFGRDLAVAVSGRAPAEAEQLLSRLEAAHRIDQYRPDRFRFHDLVRDYAWRKAAHQLDDAARAQVRTRLVEWYDRKSQVLPLDEYENVAATFRAWGEFPSITRLADTLGRFASHGHHLPELARLAEQQMAHAAGSGDPLDFVRLCNLMVQVAYATGDLVTATEYARRAVEAIDRTPGGDESGTARRNLAVALRRLGRYAEAAALMREAAQAAERYGDPHHLAVTLASLGEINRHLGRFGEAERHLLRAVSLNEALTGGPHWAGSVLSLAELRLDQERQAEAADLFARAGGILSSYPSNINRIRLLLGQARLDRLTGGAPAAGVAGLRQALELALETRTRGYVFLVQYELAELLCQAGDLDEAAGLADRYATATDRHHTPETRALRARLLCIIHTGLGDLARAVAHGREACDRFAAMPDPVRHARSLAALAAAHLAAGDATAAADATAQTRRLLSALPTGPA